jgi:feruloyl esterase
MTVSFRLCFALLTAVTIALSSSAQEVANEMVKPCMSCEALSEVHLADVRIDSVVFNGADGYCQVLGMIGKEIAFELLLPQQWNRRFVMGGGGGFVGYIMNRARNSVKDGFATVGTDTGHRGQDAGWALNNMERQVNFGHLAVHRTAATSKAIIQHYYNAQPDYSYFIGLSRGGGQAMMEAQRYPEDFDGIVAGAPAFNWVGQAMEFVQNSKAVYPDPERIQGPLITRENLQLLHKMVMEHCDGLDGVRDSILNDPRDCKLNLGSIPRCKGNNPGPGCLTDRQLEAVRTVYNGVTIGSSKPHPGFAFGGEGEKTGWFPSIVGPNKGSAPYPTWQAFYGMETFRYLIFNDPEWSYRDYDFSGVYRDTRFASAYLDATQFDYRAFKEHGGKMIIYQGWIDPLISALDIVDHYEKALAVDPDLSSYIRLFMMPGVTHTGGNGPGKADWFTLIRDWVEKGISPERVTLSRSEKERIPMSRPVFPYPRKAIYDGNGDPNLESSFK